jgi:hypothetical protein
MNIIQYLILLLTYAYRCLLDKDPIAQKHAARINQMRGTYDSMGNRLPPVNQPIKRGRRRKKRTESTDINLAGNETKLF